MSGGRNQLKEPAEVSWTLRVGLWPGKAVSRGDQGWDELPVSTKPWNHLETCGIMVNRHPEGSTVTAIVDREVEVSRS